MPTIEQYTENIQRANRLVGRYFLRFITTIDAAEASDFFDSRNRDLWTRAFAEFLIEQRNPDFPSDD